MTCSIPVIDFSAVYEEESSAAMQKLVKDVSDCMRDVGFFQITGHKFVEEKVQKMFSTSKEFFDLPLEKKSEVSMGEDYPYGYENTEVLKEAFETTNAIGFIETASTAGGKVEEAQQNASADAKETFSFSLNTANGKYPTRFPSCAHFKNGSFKDACIHYYESCYILAKKILEVFALALKLPRNYFADKVENHQSALRLLNYPHQDDYVPGQIRATQHSDYGILTILKQDGVGGLQVRRVDDEGQYYWTDVIPKDGCFVVNIGDLFMRWTNDIWKSTVHRVISPAALAGKESNRRQSCAFFFNANTDCLVETFPDCYDENGKTKYEPVIAGDYLMAKHTSANPATNKW